MITRKVDDGTMTYHGDQKAKDIVFKKIIDWLIEHNVTCGESIMQCDSPHMAAPELLVEIVDEIELDFKYDDEI